ncbi:pentapeptide repeat-containing protein [Bacillus sp. 165]|uniref:pentapeptide repeat-containing protein n=1 Tax=Bacillus sp. 165 TaxID=1529117 RepID=UPI001AD98E99|nr:pentapeptide repeat-containing protein [Bacillus sp. 165]MBO9129518.1 pentapeptide repeat-containing protein [Bacillus sp. 165]
MNEKVTNYLDGLFAPYDDMHEVKELKEELYGNLQEKFNDFKNQGHDDETAYRMTINSIGDIKEIIESVSVKTEEYIEKDADVKGPIREIIASIFDKTKDLKHRIKHDFSKINLRNSDFKGVTVHHGKFNYSDLKGSDFSGSDLTNSTFIASDLSDVTFDDANLTGVKLKMSNLKNTSFHNCVLDYTDFSYSGLAGISFENQTFTGTIFHGVDVTGTSFKNAVFRNVSIKHTDFSKAILDGATMDKLAYAVLKGSKANLTNITVI